MSLNLISDDYYRARKEAKIEVLKEIVQKFDNPEDDIRLTFRVIRDIFIDLILDKIREIDGGENEKD